MKAGWRKTLDSDFVSHWSKPFVDFNTSTLDFYTRLEAAFAAHEAPDVDVSRVVWKERSLASPDRVYLRFERLRIVCDVCAAPFGNDFFFSVWTVIQRPSLTLLHCVGMAITLFLLTTLFSNVFGFFRGIFLLTVVLGLLWQLLRSGRLATPVEFEEFLLGLTVIGAITEVRLRKPTYFELDSALMFHTVVHAAVLECIDELTDAKGLPRIGPSDRKPINRDFFKR